MAAWPGTLPTKPLMASLVESGKDMVQRTTMKFGRDKVRKLYTAAVRKSHVVYQMTAAQLDTFITFHDDTCSGGAVTFTMTHWRAGVGSKTFGFASVPKWTEVGGLVGYFVEYDLEELP